MICLAYQILYLSSSFIARREFLIQIEKRKTQVGPEPLCEESRWTFLLHYVIIRAEERHKPPNFTSRFVLIFSLFSTDDSLDKFASKKN